MHQFRKLEFSQEDRESESHPLRLRYAEVPLCGTKARFVVVSAGRSPPEERDDGRRRDTVRNYFQNKARFRKKICPPS